MSKELKLSIYDPIVKAKREVVVTEEEARDYLTSLKDAQEKIKAFFSIKNEK
jgi:hypothetical protein